ncbi:response regulator [Chiayiivirga flava]|uniref:DNA-binding response OmpR family regulator n=1 Tax=Chiayiivirga flava TaxID=659595 RepID=A0A7W8FZL2_9GAMM|nr:response regulator [Chiayiivirga flava]MBB5206753.1 DNA-binding response OmpR family regulator [Chiayiivirga flava]
MKHDDAAPLQTLAWRSELEAWCEAFEPQLDAWVPAEVAALFERIESLASLADVLAAGEAADAAAAIAVYLCTFADADLIPDAHQRTRLRELVESLARAVAPARGKAAPERRAPSPHLFRVLHLQGGGHDDALAAALGQQRVAVSPMASLDAARLALDKALPDAVLLPADRIDALQPLLDVAARHGSAVSHRVLWAVVGLDADLTLRLHARRAGADVVLPETQPDRAAALLIAALLRRRESAYRVLVVEDDRGQAMFCESLLRHQGFEVDIASDAQTAQTLLRQRTPDLILLDIQLPDLDGIQLAQRIREQASLAHVPIVFLTGEDDLDRRAEAMAAGGDDFLAKPVRPRHLIAHVNSRIDRARQLAQPARAASVDEDLSSRVDRVRFVEAIERVRRLPGTCAAVAVVAMDQVNATAARLGFVRTGDLALQIGLAVAADYGGEGHSCSLGEFSHLVLLHAASEQGLRNEAAQLRQRLAARGWLSTSVPLKVGFSVGMARYDGCGADPDSVIAAAIEAVDGARAREDRLALRDLGADVRDTADPLRRIVAAMLSQPLTPSVGELHFRPLMPVRGTREGQFLARLMLRPPGARTAPPVAPDVHGEIASSLGVSATLDRFALRLLRHYASSAAVASRGWRVLLQVSDATLEDPMFTHWLRSDGPAPEQLLLLVPAAKLLAGSAAIAALERASQTSGWMLRLSDPAQFDAAFLRLGNPVGVMIDAPDAAALAAHWGGVTRAVREHGKFLVVAGVDQVRDLGPLFAHDVDYALGDSVGDWQPTPAFEATEPREQ